MRDHAGRRDIWPSSSRQRAPIALDGTSLTVNAVDGTDFDVLLIRHTLEVTTWGKRKAGDFVNFEVDTMARYAARLAGRRRKRAVAGDGEQSPKSKSG